MTPDSRILSSGLACDVTSALTMQAVRFSKSGMCTPSPHVSILYRHVAIGPPADACHSVSGAVYPEVVLAWPEDRKISLTVPVVITRCGDVARKTELIRC